jgi:hypothetical protein
MPTECISDLFGFTPVEERRVEASFDVGMITSNAGGLLLGSTDWWIGLPVLQGLPCSGADRT